MRVGVPTEIKVRESRVALTPEGARTLARAGHEVVVQEGAGLGSGFTDDAYTEAGAAIGTVVDAWSGDLVVKVKEPVPEEYSRLRADLTLFAFLHLAANRPLAEALLSSGCTAISYDTVQAADGSLPLLASMSEVAGRLAVIVGAYHLLGPQGGTGVLLSGLPTAEPVRVAAIGVGVAGSNAIAQAVHMGAKVTALDLNERRLTEVATRHAGAVEPVLSSPESVATAVAEADLVVGAVLVPGRAAPKVVTHAMVEAALPGSVFVDIAIDQGGCFEDSHPTTHDNPTFRVANSVFYCVANMPGAAAATSTQALTSVTFPFVEALAEARWERACAADPALSAGLAVATGELRHAGVAASFPDLPLSVA